MVDHYSVVHYLYELFYKKKYGNEKYLFKPTSAYLKLIDKFLSKLDKKYNIDSIGVNFLLNYFIFQFEYWDNLTISTFSERINLQMILGDKALDRFYNRNSNFDYKFYESKFIIKNDISLSKIKDHFKEQENNLTIKFEEKEKKRFHGTDRGFLNCIEKTTLFNHFSSLCVVCKFKVDCKILLNNNYKNIYIQRGYGK